MLKELSKLVSFLGIIKFGKDDFFGFMEDGDPGNKYALTLCVPLRHANAIASYFGCPSGDLAVDGDSNSCESVYFTASDNWHGNGLGNLRALADEIILTEGDFFDLSVNLDQLREMDAKLPVVQSLSKGSELQPA